uniref:Uncharacterized protein n=1 Tax=Anguilla anguilla TaxID=7936 RepID=A0A0E9SLT9_ANGAN
MCAIFSYLQSYILVVLESLDVFHLTEK